MSVLVVSVKFEVYRCRSNKMNVLNNMSINDSFFLLKNVLWRESKRPIVETKKASPGNGYSSQSSNGTRT